MRMRIRAPPHHPQSALMAKAFNGHDDQFATRRFLLNAHSRNERHAQIHSHEFLDRLDGSDFSRDVQRRLEPSEHVDHFLPGRRVNVMGDEGFSAQFPDVNSRTGCEAMLRADDQGQLVPHDQGAFQVAVIGKERQDRKVEVALTKFIRKSRRHLTKHFDLDLGVLFPKSEDQPGKQVKACALVGPDAYSAALQAVQLQERRERFVPEVQQPFGVVVEHIARIGQHIGIAIGPVEQRGADLLFELTQRHAQGGLSAKDALGRLVKVPFLDHRDKHFELHQFHAFSFNGDDPPITRIWLIELYELKIDSEFALVAERSSNRHELRALDSQTNPGGSKQSVHSRYSRTLTLLPACGQSLARDLIRDCQTYFTGRGVTTVYREVGGTHSPS